MTFRKPSGPARRGQPMFNVPPVTLACAVAIVAVYLAIQVLPEALWLPAADRLVVVPARFSNALANGDWGGIAGLLPALVGHALIHVELLHLAVNAGFLLAFGSICERLMGRPRYILLLAASAAGGAVAQIATDWGQPAYMFGASGAVSGCFGAYARMMMATGDPARQRLAVNLIGVLALTNLAFALFGGALVGSDAGIAWQAHIGGFLVGLALGRAPIRR
jgi:membrane associated rhomboid family serine protease